MALDLAYWQKLGTQLGWKSQFRPDAFTSDCESRARGYVDYLIIHHGASTSEAGMVAIMQPGDSREVSANRILGTDGVFRRVVPEALRAWTSASWLDDIADTVETVNVTGGPNWEIADLSKIALAIWAVEKFRAGRLKALNRSYIIGHYEVLSISGDGYATACPGPDMQLDLIAELAQAIDKGLLGPGAQEEEMAGVIIVRNVGTNSKWAGNVIAFSPYRARKYSDSDKSGANAAARRLGQPKNADGSYFVNVANDVELTLVAHAHGLGNADLEYLDAQTVTTELDIQKNDIIAAIKAALVAGVTATAEVDEESIAEKVANEQDRRAAKRLSTVVDA